jgi:hypothetical protein
MPLGRERMSGVYGISLAIETFVLAHELAHVHAGHLEGSAAPKKRTGFEKPVEADFYQLSHIQEYEADGIGWDWYQSSWKGVPVLQSFPGNIARVAPLYFFLLLALIETNTSIPDSYSTHPSSLKRLERLIRRFQEEGDIESLEKASILYRMAATMPRVDEKWI